MTTIKITNDTGFPPAQLDEDDAIGKNLRCDRFASEQAKVKIITPKGKKFYLCRHHVKEHFADRFEWELQGYRFVDLISEEQDLGRTGVGGLTDAD